MQMVMLFESKLCSCSGAAVGDSVGDTAGAAVGVAVGDAVVGEAR